MKPEFSDTELQFIAQSIEGTTIKGNQAIFTATLLQKIYNYFTSPETKATSNKK